MILAPLRGVTIRCFREVFADIIRETGFTEAVTPFIPAMAGSDPLKDRELRDPGSGIRDRGSGVVGIREREAGVVVISFMLRP